MQLTNKQIMEVWDKMKNDPDTQFKVTSAFRELIKIFVTCNPTLGFLVYPKDGGAPVYKKRFNDFRNEDYKYFVALMAKPRPHDLTVPPKQVYEEKEVGKTIGKEVIDMLEHIMHEESTEQPTTSEA